MQRRSLGVVAGAQEDEVSQGYRLSLNTVWRLLLGPSVQLWGVSSFLWTVVVMRARLCMGCPGRSVVSWLVDSSAMITGGRGDWMDADTPTTPALLGPRAGPFLPGEQVFLGSRVAVKRS